MNMNRESSENPETDPNGIAHDPESRPVMGRHAKTAPSESEAHSQNDADALQTSMESIESPEDPFDDEPEVFEEAEAVFVTQKHERAQEPIDVYVGNRKDAPMIQTVLEPQGVYIGGGAHYAGAPAHGAPRARRQKRNPLAIFGIIVACVLVAFGIAFYIYKALVVNVTVNGESHRMISDFSAVTLVEESGVEPAPGNLLAIDGTLLRANGGYPFTITVNDGEPTNEDIQLEDGDVVVISDGADMIEPYDEEVVAIPAAVVNTGSGAVHVYSEEDRAVAEQNVIKRVTGQISGKVKEEQIGEQPQVRLEHQNIDVGDEKVIALTFDDGPWKDYTEQILQVLAENDAKATFFNVGERIEKNPDLTARAYNEGHEICTHSYDHASGSGDGVDLGRMSVEEQIAEIVKGNEAISTAIGTENPASRIIRAPGGNYSDALASVLEPYVDAEIGWNVDTNDWRRPGTEVIAERILSVGPGGIVLMHDGGGDRSQTVEALSIALPQLREQGYRFVTISELLQLGGLMDVPDADQGDGEDDSDDNGE